MAAGSFVLVKFRNNKKIRMPSLVWKSLNRIRGAGIHKETNAAWAWKECLWAFGTPTQDTDRLLQFNVFTPGGQEGIVFRHWDADRRADATAAVSAIQLNGLLFVEGLP